MYLLVVNCNHASKHCITDLKGPFSMELQKKKENKNTQQQEPHTLYLPHSPSLSVPVHPKKIVGFLHFKSKRLNHAGYANACIWPVSPVLYPNSTSFLSSLHPDFVGHFRWIFWLILNQGGKFQAVENRTLPKNSANISLFQQQLGDTTSQIT